MFINKETLKLSYRVEADEDGLKIIDIAISKMNISSRLFRKCKNHHNIFLNDVGGSVNRLVHPGDVVSILLDHDENTFEPNPIDVSILYEDCDLVVVNKAPFLVVHPTKGHPYGTLANALSHYQYQKGDNYKIRFINRLDRDTSGVLLVAKNAFSQQIVSEQMIRDEVDKTYYAIVEGCVHLDQGTIDLPIDREQEADIKRIVMDAGMPSVTHFEVVERLKSHTLLKLKLETGRTHQIRVHLSHIGHPILGDVLYGNGSDLIDRQALHCYEMAFKPPREAEKIAITADLPDDFKRALHLASEE